MVGVEVMVAVVAVVVVVVVVVVEVVVVVVAWLRCCRCVSSSCCSRARSLVSYESACARNVQKDHANLPFQPSP